MERKYEPTEEQFRNVFCPECELWLRFYGMLDWKVIYAFGPLDNPENIAETHINLFGRCATICLNNQECSPFPFADKTIRSTAFHEVSDILTGRLSILARSRFCTDDEIHEAGHEITRILEHVIFGNRDKLIGNSDET